ncbi:MAG TPA: FkbM family methyltransferase [Steroidobacteraceae bacterium]|jgi:FkbM family methyltransferase|nr:FkbM family methyltransferase [Steroidobacteraceae bacterium]
MKIYYEVRPGGDALRYLLTYGLLTLLARRARKRPNRLFVEISSNIDRHILSEGLFEKGVLDMLREFCQKTGHTDLMIDVGANIGNHTVALAPVFKRVEAVEPHPVLFRVLEANALYNHLAHVRCHNMALANENTSATLAASPDNHALNRVRERSQLPPETFGLTSAHFSDEYRIELRSAREFIGQFASQLDRAFIKIDVEGMEQEIILAIEPLLRQHRPLVGFEWFTRSQPQLTQIVRSIPGYEVWVIRAHDSGGSRLWRALKMMFHGRAYTLERLDAENLDDVYPLALLVPLPRAS